MLWLISYYNFIEQTQLNCNIETGEHYLTNFSLKFEFRKEPNLTIQKELA